MLQKDVSGEEVFSVSWKIPKQPEAKDKLYLKRKDYRTV